MLIVLDNCEHLLDAVAALAKALTTQAPGVRLLATSQALLNVSGEQLFRLDALSLPGAGEPPSEDEHGAIALFVERARAADTHFALSAANAGAVADICRRLDGMPLAIELAAARVRSIGVQGVRERLDERFRLLTGGSRTSAPRHQTLLAALEWSHALLSAAEQAVLRRLSVFVGGFSLELAQKVAGDESIDEWAVLDALAALVDKSLVIADQGETPRYRLLESTRAYALKQLAAAGEDRTYRDRHMQAVRDLFVPSEEAWVAASELRMGRASEMRLHSEIDNLRAALDWAASTDADVRSTIALAGAGASQFIMAGLSKEGLDRMLPLRTLVDAHAPPRQAALFYLGLVRLGISGRLPRDVLLDAAARSVQVHRALGSRLPLLNALLLQGKAMSEVGMADACDAVLSEVLALEQAGDSVYYAFSRLNIQAQLAKQHQRPDEALRLYIERRDLLVAGSADEVTLRFADADICTTLNELGRFEEAVTLADALIERGSPKGIGLEFVTLHKVNAEIMLRRTEAARQTTLRYLSLWRNAGFLMYNLDAFAVMVADDGKFADAARLAGASQAFVRRTQVWLPPLGPDWDQALPARFAAAGIAPADIERWKQQGEAMEEPELAALLDGR
ncbi:MAG: hypothetical protein IPM02_09325 [Betaproteobacteria bacterium]|nr:hypothetical protein [Betaproteobacteria bacterium]